MPASRLVFALALLLGCLSALAAGHAQQPPKVFRIGFLGSGSPADTDPRLEAFRQRLRDLGYRDLGYIEGRTIVISIDGQRARWSGFPLSPPSSSHSRST